MPLKVAVMASGKGSNFSAIVNGIDNGEIDAEIILLVCDNHKAGALEIAKQHGIPTKVITKREFLDKQLDKQHANLANIGGQMIDDLAVKLTALHDFDIANKECLLNSGAELIVLAGYLSIVGPEMVSSFRNRIINVHPALLPSFGGDGFYGLRVHQAVLDAGCKVSGATVHFVDEGTDTGRIIEQDALKILDDDDASSLQQRISTQIEHKILPKVINDIACGKVKLGCLTSD